MNYEQLLRTHTLKVTPQRLGILNLMERSGHISIEQLYKEIKVHFSAISLATLYKNIHAMMATSLITEVQLPHMKPRYEITKETHGHLLCTECGCFEDIAVNLNDVIKEVSNTTHYKIDESQLVLSGRCVKCQN